MELTVLCFNIAKIVFIAWNSLFNFYYRPNVSWNTLFNISSICMAADIIKGNFSSLSNMFNYCRVALIFDWFCLGF